MTRRRLLNMLASLPLIGSLIAKSSNADGVSLQNISHESVWPAKKHLARKGDIVSCENGHFICRFARDVEYGVMQDLDNDLTDFIIERPEIGDMTVDPCPICGGQWWRPEFPHQFHLSEGWR